MEEHVWLQVLGPVEIRDGDGYSRLPGPQLRLLLGLSALSAGQLVPVGELVEALWEDTPPRSARASLQILVTRLRKALAGLPDCTVERHGDGYRLQVSPRLVDAHQFRSLVSSARRCADHDDAAAVLGQALALWRGPALADVPATAAVEAIRAGLAEEHLAAVQDRFERLLAAGRDAETAAEIPPWLAKHPLAERLAGMLMLAWYRRGRQADALRVFRQLRARMAAELGIEPGADLQRLHQQILTGDPALAVPEDDSRSPRAGGIPASPGQDRTITRPGSRPSGDHADENGRQPAGRPGKPGLITAQSPDEPPGRARPGHPPWSPPAQANGSTPAAKARDITGIPRQLPASPAHFTGRQKELSSLTARLDENAIGEGPVILTISGPPGVGKTALALRWAHQVQQQFPDGQVYLNLRGFDASPAPVTPAEAISSVLESFGLTIREIPATLDARASLYRSLLAGRRILVMLDNARDEAQVRPLLPGSAACIILITSRNELGGLTAAEGARPLALDALAEPEARQLLARRIGSERSAAEPEAITELASLCYHLPLALTIAAARAAARPAFRLDSIAAGLRSSRNRLDALEVGDQATSVRAVFSWSYRLLTGPAARMFRLLGAFPVPDIPVAAAANLAAVSVSSAQAALSELVRANLVQEPAPGRYTQHDLLRAYAADLSDVKQRRDAVQRVLGYYLCTAQAAIGRVYPWARPPVASPPSPGATPEQLASAAQALAWLQSEHRMLLAAAKVAVDQRFDAYAWQLPAVLGEHLARRGHYLDWAQSQQAALTAATRTGDNVALAFAHRSLGEALVHLGSSEDAHRHLQDALQIYESIGDQAGQASCHCGLGLLAEAQDDHTLALRHARHALRLYRAAGDQAGQARALNGVGWHYALLGNSQQARSYCTKALELHRRAGNRCGEAATLDSLGYCFHQAGRHRQAIAFYQQALGAYTDAGERTAGGSGQTLIHLGETHMAAGDPQAARAAWKQALAILDSFHHHDAAPVRARLQDLTVPASRG
jgi:DNA-binding SARP family transcriptional activator/tetratricopeptide (TPR) repeat protein